MRVGWRSCFVATIAPWSETWPSRSCVRSSRPPGPPSASAARPALLAASVLGDRVGVARLAAAVGLSGEALTRALDELEWERWMIADPRGYGFRARIVREVVARDMLMPGQRRRLRAAAGLPDTTEP